MGNLRCLNKCARWKSWSVPLQNSSAATCCYATTIAEGYVNVSILITYHNYNACNVLQSSWNLFDYIYPCTLDWESSAWADWKREIIQQVKWTSVSPFNSLVRYATGCRNYIDQSLKVYGMLHAEVLLELRLMFLFSQKGQIVFLGPNWIWAHNFCAACTDQDLDLQ